MRFLIRLTTTKSNTLVTTLLITSSGSPVFSFMCVCVHTVLPLEIPDLHPSLSVSSPSHNEGERTQELGDRAWRECGICTEFAELCLSFSLQHQAKITGSWISMVVRVAMELSSHLVTKQQHRSEPLPRLLPGRNMQLTC